MKIKVTAKLIRDDRLGVLTAGQVVEMIDHKALFFIARGEVTPYEVKVLPLAPASVAPPAPPAPAKPAAKPRAKK